MDERDGSGDKSNGENVLKDKGKGTADDRRLAMRDCPQIMDGMIDPLVAIKF